ncbi:hypothetical protein [Terrihalobacillus insolitus]|uniref:hypothetical protein n=1 Tax=Terrihalobacillus insolitus TaxID=2950438 RepID=UPI00234141F0|nr:hypothetical protein [Terrihalobacillus insolitus]MDC3413925.1 hypothetical protein [Terrihalobacillus insolitus]
MKRLFTNWKKTILYTVATLTSLVGFSIVAILGLLLFMEDNYQDKVQAAETSQVQEADDTFHKPKIEDLTPLEKVEVEKTEYISEEQFVADLHSHFNEITGWGAYENLDMNQADHFSRAIVVYTKYFIDKGIEDKSLEQDFNDMRELGLKVVNEKDEESVKLLHRYLHDLDKAINGYEHEDTFGVTKTLTGK